MYRKYIYVCCDWLTHMGIENFICVYLRCANIWFYVSAASTYYLLQHTIMHCNTLQHTAPHHNTLQHTAAHCNTLQHTASHCITLQHTATHYNTLQHTATHGNTLQSAQIQIRTLFYPHLFSHIRDMTHSYVCCVFHLCTHQVRRYQI